MARWVIHSKAGSISLEAPTGTAALAARARDLATMRDRGIITEAQWRARQPLRVEAMADGPIVSVSELYAPVER